MSRFVRQWATQLPENSMQFFSQSITLNTTRLNIRLKSPKSPTLLKRLLDMAKKGLSATALSNYIADPIRFYNNHVLSVSETEELEESVANHTLGIVIHNTLEELYTPYVSKALTVKNIERMQGAHKQILQKHFENQLGKSSHTTGKKPIVVFRSRL